MSCSQTEAPPFAWTRLSRRLQGQLPSQFFSCQQPACTLHYFSYFPIFTTSCLEFKDPTVAIVPENKITAFFPASVRWRGNNVDLVVTVAKIFSQEGDWGLIIQGLISPFLPHPLCFLWSHTAWWIRCGSNQVKICGSEMGETKCLMCWNSHTCLSFFHFAVLPA